MVGCEGSEDEPDERDGQAETRDEEQNGRSIVGELNQAVVDAGRETVEVRGDGDVGREVGHSASPLPAEPALTYGRGRGPTRRRHARTWSQRRNCSRAGAALAD